jgi:hypothetical protein
LQHGETNARSTALHAALLAAADVRVHRHPGSRTCRRRSPADLPLPRYDPASTVVLFPEGPQTPVVGHCPPFSLVVVLGERGEGGGDSPGRQRALAAISGQAAGLAKAAGPQEGLCCNLPA